MSVLGVAVWLASWLIVPVRVWTSWYHAHETPWPVHTAQAPFPTAAFPGMYAMPTAREAQPVPKVTNCQGDVYPLALVDARHLPSAVPSAEGVLPLPVKGAAPPATLPAPRSCGACVAVVRELQALAHAAPSKVPARLKTLCPATGYADCARTLDVAAMGGVLTQMLSYADLSENSTDAAMICARWIPSMPCKAPMPEPLSSSFLDAWFGGAATPPKAVAERSRHVGPAAASPLRVLHVSDFHLDPRYMVGAESQCDNGMCCRVDSTWKGASAVQRPAPYWGAYLCDAPWSLIGAAMDLVARLTARRPLALALLTGDVTAHDRPWHMSRSFVTYAEHAALSLLHKYVGGAPVAYALGNHDSSPSDFAPYRDLPDGRSAQMDWHWTHLARLLTSLGWIDNAAARSIEAHHGHYVMRPRRGLRVLVLNTDYWYRHNPMNYVRTADPDASGMLRWLTDALQAAEDAHERVWIVGHIPPGYSQDALPAPSALMARIVQRYTHTIAAMFFGHSHEDVFSVYYADGATSDRDAVGIALIGPSLTPLRLVNPGVRLYDVDPETYEVLDYVQYATPLDTEEAGDGPTWRPLYSARDAYSSFHASVAAGRYTAGVALDHGRWPAHAPLNASFWAALTTEMEVRPELVETHHQRQGRNSTLTWPCTSAQCHAAKICHLRSGTSAQAAQCAPGYHSVQSGRSPEDL